MKLLLENWRQYLNEEELLAEGRPQQAQNDRSIEKEIGELVQRPEGNCFFHAALLALIHPELKLIKGQHSQQYKGDSAHFWLEDAAGKIIDPTASQYKPGTYTKDREVSPERNLGHIVGHPLFGTLSKDFQKKIKAHKREHIFENWRKFLKEEQEDSSGAPKLGAYVDFEAEYRLNLILLDLNFMKNHLEKSANIEEFIKKISNKELYEKAVVGYIETLYNPMLSRAQPAMGGSGGACANTYQVRRSMAPKRGEQLYNALLGFAATEDIYISSDRRTVSPGAQKRWAKIDQQTDDEVPAANEPYMGRFDDYTKPETDPKDDDCIVHGIEQLDKGYKDTKQVDFYKELEYNLNTFFENEIEPLFDEPGFFGRILGSTPENKANRLKMKLLKYGKAKFTEWEMAGMPWKK